MAKGNMLLGQARGKVGSIVFSRVDGQQITRSLAENVSNPRSYGQNVQRAVFTTVSKAAAIMRAIVDHSYAGVAYDTPSLRHFRKINMEKIRNEYVNGDSMNLTYKGGQGVPNDYIISQGILPTISTGRSFGIGAGFNVYAGQQIEKANATANITWLELKSMIPGLQESDQLTVVRWRLVGGSVSEGTASFAFSYDRVIFATNIADTDTVLTAAGLNGDFVDLTRTTSLKTLIGATYENTDGDTVGIEADIAQGGSDLYAIGIIMSRYVGNQWQRSTQSLEMTNSSRTNLDAAVESYGDNATSLASDAEYLNQADATGSSVATLSNPYMHVEISSTNGERLSKVVGVGDTLALGNIFLADGLAIKATAYGGDSASVVAIDIEGTSADGDLEIIGRGNSASKSVEFAPGEDGNLAGNYTITAVFQSKQGGNIYKIVFTGTTSTETTQVIQGTPRAVASFHLAAQA